MWTHRALASRSVYQRELRATQDAIEQATGVRPVVFRPPYGRKTPWLLQEASRLNLVTVTWSVSAKDPHSPAPEVIAQRVVSKTRPGAIILLHDGVAGSPPSTDRSNTVKALPLVLTELRARGYTFVTVSELLAHSGQASAGVESQGA